MFMFSLVLGLPKCKNNGQDPSLEKLGLKKYVRHGLTCFQAHGLGLILKNGKLAQNFWQHANPIFQ